MHFDRLEDARLRLFKLYKRRRYCLVKGVLTSWRVTDVTHTLAE